VRLGVHPEVQPVLLLAPTGLSTAVARDLLPASVPHTDASRNAGRAGLLTAALTAYPELLLAATEDLLHQEFRREAMPETLALVARLRAAGLPAVVSGAGPSVLVLATRQQSAQPELWSPVGWRQLRVSVDPAGARQTDGTVDLRE
jgi:homoserine kinase